MWEWAVRYDLGSKRCGSRGWVLDLTTALVRVKRALEGLPRGVAASGQIRYHPPAAPHTEPVAGRVAYDMERTTDDVIHWYPKEDGPQK